MFIYKPYREIIHVILNLDGQILYYLSFFPYIFLCLRICQFSLLSILFPCLSSSACMSLSLSKSMSYRINFYSKKRKKLSFYLNAKTYRSFCFFFFFFFLGHPANNPVTSFIMVSSFSHYHCNGSSLPAIGCLCTFWFIAASSFVSHTGVYLTALNIEIVSKASVRMEDWNLNLVCTFMLPCIHTRLGIINNLNA